MNLLTHNVFYKLLVLSLFLSLYPLAYAREPVSEAKSPTTKKSTEYADLLQFVTVPEAALPKGVRLVKPIQTASILGVKQNPATIDQPQQLKLIAMFFGMRDKADLKTVEACIVAIYQDKEPANEIGVYGLIFANKKAAKKWYAKISKGQEKSPYIVKERLLLYLWKDSGAKEENLIELQKYFKTAKFDIFLSRN